MAQQTEGELFSAERMVFFSDAVVAIAITLLAIDLPLPQGHTASEVFSWAGQHVSEFAGFFISFWVIAQHWGAHHRTFRLVEAVTGRLMGLGFWWLLAIVVTPYATRVLMRDGPFGIQFAFYAVVQLVAIGVFMLMTWECRARGLLLSDAARDRVVISVSHGIAMAVTVVIAIPVAFFTNYAPLILLLIPTADRLARRAWDGHAARRARRVKP